MPDRSTRLQLARFQLERATELTTTAERELLLGHAEESRAAEAEARVALAGALALLDTVEGICDVHLRPLHGRVRDAEERLRRVAFKDI